jgi:hypothetical protein
VCQDRILEDALGLKYEPLTCLNFLENPSKSYEFLKKSCLLYMYRNFVVCLPTVDYVWPAGTSSFHAFFHVYLC